jgi:nucleoside-diphosphate-sugar epimerase
VDIERILLTGGAGFLGQAILRELAKPAGASAVPLREIRVLDLAPIEAAGRPNVVPIAGDVCDRALLRDACRDVDAVVHLASLIDWGGVTAERLEQVNVQGTENVLDACRELGVPRLVYTSTMDVVCGKQPVVKADETLAYPETFTNDYARTKAEAEQKVLAAHGTKRAARDGEDPAQCRLATCALRPCGMYGEGDPYHVANVLRVVREGRLPFRIGDGKAVFEHVYVGNVAHAHLLALRRLGEPGSAIGGQAYFVTDDTEALDFLDFMEHVLEPLGYPLPPKSRRAPYPLVFGAAAAMEAVSRLCRPLFRFTPTLTRSSVRFVCHEHSFVGDKLRRDLDYHPIYSEAESLERTIEYFRGQ